MNKLKFAIQMFQYSDVPYSDPNWTGLVRDSDPHFIYVIEMLISN